MWFLLYSVPTSNMKVIRKKTSIEKNITTTSSLPPPPSSSSLTLGSTQVGALEVRDKLLCKKTELAYQDKVHAE